MACRGCNGDSARQCCSTWGPGAFTSSVWSCIRRTSFTCPACWWFARSGCSCSPRWQDACGAGTPARRPSTPKCSCGSSAVSRVTARRTCGATRLPCRHRSCGARAASTWRGWLWRSGLVSALSPISLPHVNWRRNWGVCRCRRGRCSGSSSTALPRMATPASCASRCASTCARMRDSRAPCLIATP